jgi:hypothetical protein
MDGKRWGEMRKIESFQMRHSQRSPCTETLVDFISLQQSTPLIIKLLYECSYRFIDSYLHVIIASGAKALISASLRQYLTYKI